MFNMTDERTKRLIYIAIAVATAFHTAWSYSTTMEGAEPLIDWANFTLNVNGIYLIMVWGWWLAKGALAAFAIDVGMFVVAKSIREARQKNLLGLYITYLAVSVFSAYFQVMYSVQHSADFQTVTGIPEWLNAVFLWRFLLVPLSLPVIGFFYTMSVRVDEALNKQVLGKVDTTTGKRKFDVKEAAKYTNRSEAGIRGMAASGKLPAIKDDDNKLVFDEDELAQFIKG